MVGSQADPVVARAFGGVVLASHTAIGATSYDSRGQRFVFRPAPGDLASYALDIETVSAEMSPGLRVVLGVTTRAAALRAWTELELRAKLTNTPVLACLKSPPTAKICLRRADTATHWIAIGKLS